MSLKSLECNVVFCLEEIDINPPKLEGLWEAWSENYALDFNIYFHHQKMKIYVEIRAFQNPGKCTWLKENWIVFARALENGEIPDVLESYIKRIMEEV